MRVIFCSEPFAPARPDPAYESELLAAQRVGLESGLINFEALADDNDPDRAVRRVAIADAPELAVYRGWMLRPEQYSLLYAALGQRGLHLINTPESYRHCHYLPESYPVIREYTPRTLSLKLGESFSLAAVMELLEPFGDRLVVLKDYVKSRKHEWDEACFIPSASDQAAVERVVNRFIELQGDQINEGLVFREFVEFEPLTTHSRSGMPLTKEFRLFFLDGELLYALEYWEEGDYSGSSPPSDLFGEVARRVESRFFTMDVARRRDGEWMIVELGDAQVAGLPDNADVTGFYERLKSRSPQLQ
ncbi:MAG TPA: ATP-grasp domain-containing protein [Blastocatellia bacterium]|nr:ATP-grasp domain-containing protein [Blastocatellia bacterium]